VKTTWEKIGTIGVDAGLCWIGDPCYLSEDKAPFHDWGGFCDRLFETDFNEKRHAQYHYDHGHPGLGVLVESGYGDGTYEVFARKNGAGRIAEVRIVFVDPKHDGPAYMSEEDWLAFVEQHFHPAEEAP